MLSRSHRLMLLIGVLVCSLFLTSLSFGEATLDQSVFEKANIDWRQFEGETINLLLCKHPMASTFLELIDEFEALTGIKVEALSLPEQQFFERQTIVLTSSSPEFDIVMTSPMLNWKFIPGGYLEPLDQYLNNPELTDLDFYDMDDFVEMAIEASRVMDNLYAIPAQLEAYALYYRTDLFSKYGIKVPETLDEIYEAAQKLDEGFKNDGITSILPFSVRGVKGAGTINSAYLTLFSSYGGRDFDEEGNPAIYSEPVVEMTDLWIKLIRDFGPRDWPTLDWYDVKDAFASGSVAMLIDADHWGGELSDPAFCSVSEDWAVALAPRGPEGIKSNIWAWSVGMNAASNHKGAAWLFLEWATSKPVMLIASSEYNNFTPTRYSAWNDPVIVERTSKWGNGTCREVVTQNLEKYAALRWTPNPNAFTLSEVWMEMLHNVWSGSMTADEALKQVNQRAQRLAPPKEWLK